MTQYNENISYEILENGYKIYLDGKLWIEQLDEYAKPIDTAKTYEENCLLQLADITATATANTDTLEERVTVVESAVMDIADVLADLTESGV